MVKFLENANSDSVETSIIDSLNRLWNGNMDWNKLWVFLTNMGSYMMKAGEYLKRRNNRMRHVTYIVHVLYNVCEAIRDENDQVNQLIASFQNITCKSYKRKKEYKQFTGFPLPTKAVITRWSTWLKTAFFYEEI